MEESLLERGAVSALDSPAIEFHNLAFSVGSKHILRGVNGALASSEFCAILGPSGSGKTSLLNAVAGRLEGVSGSTLFGGSPMHRAELRSHIAFVLQEDCLCATQTAREALLFSAALRLPRSVSVNDKRALVESMLRELRLEKCADTLIGSKMIRGLSGGEKKRVSIGVELVMKPSVLFLDEPTSGLDSYAAYSLIQTLKQLSQGGCTVLCTIHQPSSEVYHLFETILVLREGRRFYMGPSTCLFQHLGDFGVLCPPDTNPADHVMFLIQTNSPEQLDELEKKLNAATAPYTPPRTGLQADSKKTCRVASTTRDAAAVHTQLFFLVDREFQAVIRDKTGLVSAIATPLFLNLLFAVIFYQVGDHTRGGYDLQSHVGAITQVAISGMFGASQPLLLKFPLEAALFQREYATGTYGASVYFLSKTLVELPRLFVVSCLTWAATYWLMALEGNFLWYVLALWLTGLAASSTALLVGCVSSNTEVALQLAPAIFVPQILFAGFFIKTTQIPVALRWIQYLCSLKYGINLMLSNEFAPPTTNGWTPELQSAASELLREDEIKAGKWYVYGSILIGMAVGFRLLGVIALSRRAAQSSG